MKIITVEESKQLQVEILQKIHDFCERENITYYMIFGTLLGAVRHQGFIPWDDDIDIGMPRDDYELFVRNFEAENCKCVACEIDKDYYLPFGKVYDTRTVLKEDVDTVYTIGVYVDVFPLDNYSDEENVNIKNTRTLLLLRNLLSLKVLPGSAKRKGWRRIIHSVFRVLFYFENMNAISNKMNRIANVKDDECRKNPNCGFRANTDRKDIRMKIPKNFFYERAILNFEGNEYYAPKKYHELLQLTYGDYMKLPPENERITHHEYIQYWRENNI